MRTVCRIRLLFICNVVLTLMILCLIIYFSSQDGEKTYQVSMRVAQFVAGYIYENDPSQDEMYLLNQKLRLMAHVCLYVALGTVSGVWMQLGRDRRMRIFFGLLTCSFCTAVSYADEWLKQYVPGRHFHAGDFRLNVVSALVGLFVCCLFGYAVRKLRWKRGKEKPW